MAARTATKPATKPAKVETKGHTKVRHIRIPDETWDGAGVQATSDNYTLSQVTRTLLDAYRAGDIKITAKQVRR